VSAGQIKLKAIKKIVYRSVVLFLLGLFLCNMNNYDGPGSPYAHWRIPGVLQYFAFSNLYVPLVIVLTTVVTAKGSADNTVRR
jgi:predicted acyltransferase